ncbi:transposase [Streptomyces microflavus]|uniref:transposase n=1 Tax=Streptomyces microflavus TaxID=1919 RepID=UPI00379924A8
MARTGCGSGSSRCCRPGRGRSRGSRPVPDRLCRQGILFVMHHGIAWQQLPLVWGFGSGQTCWRRLDRW